MTKEARRILVERLNTDLIGPSLSDDEKIEDRPSDRYLLGILFPQNLQVPDEEDEEMEEVESGKTQDQDASPGDSVSLFRSMRPATAGVSFAVLPSTDDAPVIRAVLHRPRQGNRAEHRPDQGAGGQPHALAR